ncbi:MAG TPA: DUF2817 domain-containing protein [Steroidobacteraceae bacterium]|nr:DUF2817 domain-containing protein [Steroidobacteraceae bacterium]
MGDLSCFSGDYRASRAKFLKNVVACGGQVTSYLNAGAVGPTGEALYVDVGTVGQRNAPRSLLMISGVHGTEAIISTGLLNDFLTSPLVSALPPDMNAILVHALNPWGMAHQLRTTENNVDLNRNFIDFAAGLPSNPVYSELHPLLCAADVESAATQLKTALAPGDRAATSRVDAIMRGQYEYPDGVNFGGHREEWSNSAFRSLVAAHLSAARHVACIDWHTGIGRFAEPVPLAFHTPGTPSAQALSKWYKKDVTLIERHFPGGEAPRFAGILTMALPQMLPDAQTYAVVVEFGTKANADVLSALMIDRWLRFSADRTSPRSLRLRATISECFSPTNDQWRHAVLDSARQIAERTVAGLSSV